MAVDKVDKEVHAVVRTRTSAKTIVIRIVIALVVLGAAGAGYAFWKDLQRFETTDDAEVDGQIYAVSSRVAGHVSEVLFEDQQIVKAGDVLVRLDRKDFEVALAKANADLADAVAALQTFAYRCSDHDNQHGQHVTQCAVLEAGRAGGRERGRAATGCGARAIVDGGGEREGGRGES